MEGQVGLVGWQGYLGLFVFLAFGTAVVWAVVHKIRYGKWFGSDVTDVVDKAKKKYDEYKK